MTHIELQYAPHAYCHNRWHPLLVVRNILKLDTISYDKIRG